MPRDGQDGKMDKGPPSWEHMTDYILEGQGTHPIRWWRNLSQWHTQPWGQSSIAKVSPFWGLGLGGLQASNMEMARELGGDRIEEQGPPPK